MRQINRRVFLQAASAGLAGGAALGPLSGHAAQPTTHINTPGKRPNVVLIITDDQGYGDLGCHGNPVLKTPHIDRLHGESVRFTQFNVSPVCSPTRAWSTGWWPSKPNSAPLPKPRARPSAVAETSRRRAVPLRLGGHGHTGRRPVTVSKRAWP